MSNGGTGSLTFTASDNAPWLSVTPAGGTAPQDLSVSADLAGLAPGTYTANVTLTATGAANSPTSVPVTLTVAPPPPGPALAVAPASLAFSAAEGGPAPAPRTLDVTNGGGGSLSFTASDDAGWLSLSPAGGTAPQSIGVTANPTGLAAGTYTATVTLTAAGATGSPQTVPVTLTVRPPSAGGLVAAYGFDEPSGATAFDASGAGNPGVISGATRTPSGRAGAALTFDGVNDLVTVADSASLDFTEAVTLEAWVYPTTVAGYRTVVMKEAPGLYTWALYGSTTTGLPNGRVVTSADFDVKGPAKLPLNTWSHVAVTYDGATLRMYLNGQQTVQRAVTGPITTSARALQIGGNTIWNEWFKGRIDEVRVYDRALSAAEIGADMTQPVSAGLELRDPGTGPRARRGRAPGARARRRRRARCAACGRRSAARARRSSSSARGARRRAGRRRPRRRSAPAAR